MKTKKIIAIVVLLLGVTLFSLALYAKSEVMQVKKTIHTGSSLLPENPVKTEINRALDKKVSSYDAPILWGMIGGVVLFVVGLGSFIYTQKK